MGLIPAGRPKRAKEKGLKKARKLWMGQHPEWVLNGIVAHTTPQERFGAIWPLVEERSDVTSDQHAGAQDEDDYTPHLSIDDLDDVLRLLGDLPVRICEAVAASPCLTGERREFTHWCEENWAGWTVLVGNLGYIRLSVEMDDFKDVVWKFLVQRNDGYVVNAYKKGRSEENYCEPDKLRAELEQLLTVQISEQTYRKLRREA